MIQERTDSTWYSKYLSNQKLVVLFYWLVTFVVYLPASKAGMVGDMPYLFEASTRQTFWEFINIKQGGALYHVAAFHFYVLIKLFGTNIWLWHLLYVTIHALNGVLVYLFFSRLLKDSFIEKARALSFISALLFLVCPHASEVVVWTSSNHHATATAIIFIVLLCLQKFFREGKLVYALIASALFLYSSFSHEFFYLTPWFALVLICYYRALNLIDNNLFRKAILWFFIPLLLLFLLHLGLLRVVKHTFISHFGTLSQLPLSYYLSKPLKYVYHILFLGRYFDAETRSKVYRFCETGWVIYSFYTLYFGFLGYIIFRWKRCSNYVKAIALSIIYLIAVFVFLSPVDFADTLLVCYDRYTYPSLGFAALFLVLVFNKLPGRNTGLILLGGYFVINLWFTLKVNIYWKQSAYVVNRLLNEVPDSEDKTVLLLNLPDDLNGIPMIAAQEAGRFKLMKNQLTRNFIHNQVYDVVAYKMSTMNDGAHVMVVNDSVMHVTLNQWGTWWMYEMYGATSYENKEYKVNMIDVGHWYELTLKHPPANYQLLFQSGSQWKVVDWSKKNVDQY